jgi:hypothetical protein
VAHHNIERLTVLKRSLFFIPSLVLLFLPLTLAADEADGQDVLYKYLSQYRAQQDQTRGVQMEVSIDAKLPKLKKEGRFHALKSVSKIGKATYDAITWNADNTIRKDVIGRYLTAENSVDDPDRLAITTANYKFKYKGVSEKDGRSVHVFQLQPKRKIEGLFKGELWLDKATCLPVRESGRWVKSPSIFVKKIDFIREYELREGVAYQTHIFSVVETRVVGKAELDISFSNFSRLSLAESTTLEHQIQ